MPGQPPLRAFTLGLIAGVVCFVGTIYWTGTVIATFGDVPPPLAVFAMVLLALYLALFPAFTALLTSRVIRSIGVAGLAVAPAAWVATEFLRGYLFGGFPWVPLGNSQVEVLPIAQLASLLGVYGISALLVIVNSAIAGAMLSTRLRSRVAVAASAALLLAVVAGWGTWRVSDGRLTREGSPLKIALIQANIAQSEKWKPAEAPRIFSTYLAMTREAVRRGAEYILWPESSTPFMFEEDPVGGGAVRELARELHVPILVGSDQIERAGVNPRLYNAAFLVTPDGRTAAVYRKIHLVPFGEYIPFKSLLFFVSPLVESLADFSPGLSMVMLPVADHVTSTAICYEVVYPSLVREAVLAGSELLTTITNDAWYGASSAPYQHFALASMRAIEQGRYLARAANTGISGVVDPYGRIVAKSAIFERATLVEEIRFLRERTVYARIGDAVAYASIVLTVLAVVVTRNSRFQRGY